MYTYSRERIKWHKDQGHIVIAISGSPVELVREMSAMYGMDDYRGTIYEIGSDGAYSGKIIPMWDSASKKKAVAEMAEKHRLDLAASYAYGDTAGDISMLKLVGCHLSNGCGLPSPPIDPQLQTKTWRLKTCLLNF